MDDVGKRLPRLVAAPALLHTANCLILDAMLLGDCELKGLRRSGSVVVGVRRPDVHDRELEMELCTALDTRCRWVALDGAPHADVLLSE